MNRLPLLFAALLSATLFARGGRAQTVEMPAPQPTAPVAHEVVLGYPTAGGPLELGPFGFDDLSGAVAAPLAISGTTLDLDVDPNFAVSGGNLALAIAVAGDVIGNCTGAPAEPAPTALSACIDAALGATRGALVERGVSGWGVLAPGTSGLPLLSGGAGADPGYGTIGPGAIQAGAAAANLGTAAPNEFFASPTGGTGSGSYRVIAASDVAAALQALSTPVATSNSTPSTSATTGAIVLAGGLGVGGAVYSAGMVSGATLGIGGTSIAGNLPATATNDNANAGRVGEYIAATVAGSGAVALTSGTTTNLTSISLTPGDWDISGNVFFVASAGMTTAAAGASQVSATVPDTSTRGELSNASGLGTDVALTVPTTRVSIAAATTVYLPVYAAFASGTVTAAGFLAARRAR